MPGVRLHEVPRAIQEPHLDFAAVLGTDGSVLVISDLEGLVQCIHLRRPSGMLRSILVAHREWRVGQTLVTSLRL